ncbi:MAG: hypothetical protein AAGK09_03335 [Planctomycetota bacterium]
MAVTLYLIQLAATGVMAGLILFVGVVHYPLFSSVGEDAFAAYEARHQRLTTLVVMPTMLAELATAIAALFLRPDWLPSGIAMTGLVMLVLIWASTFFVQVPLHTRLSRGFAASHHRALVVSNIARMILWPARFVLLLYPLAAELD